MRKKIFLTIILALMLTCCTKDGETIYLPTPGEEQPAAKLLLKGELTVSEVSYKVGIQDPSYFNKLFKTRYGVVPSKYGR